ncbi:MAG: signal peptidase II [Planctomycetota bacterium]
MSNAHPTSNQENTSLSSPAQADIKDTHQGERLPISRFALFFSLLAIGLAFDLWTKTYAFSNFFDPETYGKQPQAVHWWVDGVFGLQTSTNPGALFGMGKGLSWLFALLSFVALSGIILWLFVWKAARDRWITFALGLISGGILGNLYDRVGLGYVESWDLPGIRTDVRDWILFRLDGVPMFDPWPNFNIADSLLVTGAIMLMIHALFAPMDDGNNDDDSSGKEPDAADASDSSD